MSGPVNPVVDEYLKSDILSEAYIDLKPASVARLGNGKVKFLETYLTRNGQNEYTRVFSIGDDIYFYFAIQFNNPNQSLVRTSVELKTVDGIRLANMIDEDSGFKLTAIINGIGYYRVKIADIRLYPGTYYLSLYAGDTSSTEIYDYLEDCISFEIIDGGKLTSRHLPKSAGLLFITPEWSKV